jgi:hypothetical protein
MSANGRGHPALCKSTKRRALLDGCMLLVAAQLWGMAPAMAQDAAPGAAKDAPQALPQHFIGKWVGPWRLGMNSGHVELVLSDDPRTPSTIAITNLAKFGDQRAEVQKIARDGERLLFRAYGADNSLMKASMILNPKDGSIEGSIVHDGFTNLCKLMRVP